MLHNEDISQVAVSGTHINTKYTIIKEIKCKDLKVVDLVVHNLEHLKKAKFKTIKIPHFSYKISDLTIIETCEFIKGCALVCHPEKENIIHTELVCREDEYTFSDYHHSNFIVNNNDLYAVDFSSYGYLPDQYLRNTLWINRRKSCL